MAANIPQLPDLDNADVAWFEPAMQTVLQRQQAALEAALQEAMQRQHAALEAALQEAMQRQHAALEAALQRQQEALEAALQAALQPITALLQTQYELLRTQHAVLLRAVQNAESRNIARLINGQLSQDRFSIEPLVDNNGVVPNQLPATIRDLKYLPDADVNALLTAYGQTPTGTLDERHRQLGKWLGLRQGFP